MHAALKSPAGRITRFELSSTQVLRASLTIDISVLQKFCGGLELYKKIFTRKYVCCITVFFLFVMEASIGRLLRWQPRGKYPDQKGKV